MHNSRLVTNLHRLSRSQWVSLLLTHLVCYSRVRFADSGNQYSNQIQTMMRHKQGLLHTAHRFVASTNALV